MATTQAPFDIAKCSAVVIYDRKTGDIVHVHECWTERGARHPGKRTLQTEAMGHARDARPDLNPRSVAALHVDPVQLELSPGQALRVDARRKRIARVPATGRNLRGIVATQLR